MQGPVHFIGLETVLGGDRALTPMEVGVCFFFLKKKTSVHQSGSIIRMEGLFLW